jgi:hypothetical protein
MHNVVVDMKKRRAYTSTFVGQALNLMQRANLKAEAKYDVA